MKRENGRSKSQRQAMKMAEVKPASAREIHRSLVEALLGLMSGRLSAEEGMTIGMVAEEQLRMLKESRAAGSNGGKVEVAKGPANKRRWVN